MIYIGADHGGFEYKARLKEFFDKENIHYEDVGNLILDPDDDYPDFASMVSKSVANNPDSKGILLCRSGVGMAIAADKHSGIRAVLGFDVEQVKRAREDEDANILSIASDYMEFDTVVNIVRAFIETQFSGEERHKRRMEKLEKI